MMLHCYAVRGGREASSRPMDRTWRSLASPDENSIANPPRSRRGGFEFKIKAANQAYQVIAFHFRPTWNRKQRPFPSLCKRHRTKARPTTGRYSTCHTHRKNPHSSLVAARQSEPRSSMSLPRYNKNDQVTTKTLPPRTCRKKRIARQMPPKDYSECAFCGFSSPRRQPRHKTRRQPQR